MLEEPLLYLSEFFEKNKTLYYDNLTMVRTKNDLGQWIKFFLTGVIQTAENAVNTLKKIIQMKETIGRERILKMRKRSRQAMVLLHHLFKKPVTSVKAVQSITGLSPKAANDLVQAFMKEKLLVETTGYQRNRIFLFEEYLKMFQS